MCVPLIKVVEPDGFEPSSDLVTLQTRYMLFTVLLPGRSDRTQICLPFPVCIRIFDPWNRFLMLSQFITQQ